MLYKDILIIINCKKMETYEKIINDSFKYLKINKTLINKNIYSKNDKNQTIIKTMINSNIDVNVKNNYGNTALMTVCRQTNTKTVIEIINILIGTGANVNDKNNYRQNSLMLACHHYVGT